MTIRPDPRLDIGLGLFLIVACAVVLWESRTIPPGSFEPMGSAPVPQVTAILIILLALTVIVRACLGSWDDRLDKDSELRPMDAAVFIGLTILYAGAIHLRIATFGIITTVFLILTIGFLTRFEKRLLPAVIVVALVTAFGCQYIFTRIFVVDLPGL